MCPLTTLYNSELCIWCRDMFIVILKLFAYENNFVASLAAVLSNLIKPLKTKLNSLCCSISTVKIRKSTLCHHTPVTNSRYYWEPILPCNAPKLRGRKERKRNILAKAKFVVLAVEEKYVLLQTEVSVCFVLSRIFNSLVLLLLLFMFLNYCYDFLDILKFAVNHDIPGMCLYILCNNLNGFGFPNTVLRYPPSIKIIPFLF